MKRISMDGFSEDILMMLDLKIIIIIEFLLGL
jgi:hypothetical protein